MSLETQTHSNLLFNVSTNQYAGIAENAKKQAAKKNNVSAGKVQTKTILRKETVLSSLFGVGAKTIEVKGTKDIRAIDMSDWKGATATTQITSKKGQVLGAVASSADSGRKAGVAINKGDASANGPSSVYNDFEVASLSTMLSAVRAASPSTPTTPSSTMGSAPVLESLMPQVFSAEEPISIFGTPTDTTPSFARFVEAVSTSLDKADNGFGGEEFLGDLKVAMPGFFQLLAANDDESSSFAGRGMGGYAQEAVTFAHEGLGVRRDVIDMRHGEAQERFMSVMKRIASYEAESGHNEGSSFGLDL